MISYEEAFNIVMSNAPEPVSTKLDLGKSVGFVLAEDVFSDIDMPPFDRSAMDGFAITGDKHTHELLEEIPAGSISELIVKPGIAAPIMTGAPVPEGADRIVKIEDTDIQDSILYIHDVPGKGANICLQGEDIKAGHLVLEHETRLAQQHIGIAAMAGRGVLEVFKKATVALLTTGAEVIPPTSKPMPGMIRNANLPLMSAQVSQAGFPIAAATHVTDDPPSIKATISQLMDATDVLIIAGGVSKGTRDYVPSVLNSLNVKLHFRSVAQKPGKPLLFGTALNGKPVFGLPGNPVSVMVSMEEYVIPMLRKMAGFKGFHKRTYHGKLTTSIKKKAGRMNFLRVLAYREGDEWKLHVPETSGSGDLMSTVNVNALALISADTTFAYAGETLPFNFMFSTAGELSFA